MRAPRCVSGEGLEKAPENEIIADKYILKERERERETPVERVGDRGLFSSFASPA